MKGVIITANVGASKVKAQHGEINVKWDHSEFPGGYLQEDLYVPIDCSSNEVATFVKTNKTLVYPNVRIIQERVQPF